MLEPFSMVCDSESSAAESLRRTGFHAQPVVVDRAVIVHLQGELDMATAADLQRVVDAAMAEDAATVVLDLTNLTFVDSTGISVFLRAGRQAETHGRTLKLRRPTQAVLKILRLSGLDRQLNLGSAEHPAAGRSPADDRHPGAAGTQWPARGPRMGAPETSQVHQEPPP